MTRVVVTHTLEAALLRRYDGILVLKNGRIAESGSFDELMEKKGYLTRTTDEHDARLKRLELTELGKKVHLDTIAVIDSAHDTMEAGITDEERRICFEVLEKICKNVEKITGGE